MEVLFLSYFYGCFGGHLVFARLAIALQGRPVHRTELTATHSTLRATKDAQKARAVARRTSRGKGKV